MEKPNPYGLIFFNKNVEILLILLKKSNIW